jgi:hypothetical protein
MSIRRPILTIAVSLWVVGAVVGLGGASAQALVTHEYLSQLTGFEDPVAMAFDASSDLYVVDGGEETVDRFDAEGAPLDFSAHEQYVYGSQLTGTPRGAFSALGGVAVDDATGDVYVTEINAGVVDVFSSSGEYLFDITGAPASATAPSGTATPPGGGASGPSPSIRPAATSTWPKTVAKPTGEGVSWMCSGPMSRCRA